MHNFSAESKKTESPLTTQSFATKERGLIALRANHR